MYISGGLCAILEHVMPVSQKEKDITSIKSFWAHIYLGFFNLSQRIAYSQLYKDFYAISCTVHFVPSVNKPIVIRISLHTLL